MTVATFIFALGLLIGQVRASDVAPSDLAAAKALITEAAYEEALKNLSTIQDPTIIDRVEQYRAVCFLALGRTTEAQQALERLALHNPLYKLTDAQVSPRLVTLFRDVRRRMLPVAARDVYAKAKASFDQKKYAVTLGYLDQARTMLDDPELSGLTEVRDLKSLAEGLLKLTEAWMAAEAGPARSGAPPAQSSEDPSVYNAFVRMVEAQRATRPAASGGEQPAIYSALHSDVTPPAEISAPLPAWNPPTKAEREIERRGLLEVVINERGLVESMTVRLSISDAYDASLLEASKQWRFRPARRNGEAVKYRKVIEIVLSARHD